MDAPTDQHEPRAPAEPAAYRFRGFALDPARGVLHRPDGTEILLRPKAAEMLRHFARHPGRVVSRDELMDTVWPGVIVTDDSITQCAAEIRRALGDEGAPLLRTLPRRGYALDAAVTLCDAPPADAARRGTRPGRVALAAVVAAVAAALVGVAGYRALRPAAPSAVVPVALAAAPVALAPAAVATAPRARSLVVLPFANPDGDPELDHLALGIAEDLTSDLGRRPENLVIGSGTARGYRGQFVDARRIGAELGVNYVLEGSLRRFGSALRAHARLLDASSGAQL